MKKESIRKQFEYYKSLGDRTFVQLSDEELLWQYNSASNSIPIIVKHLWGNMRSRWTDFMTTDGEKPWRDRDGEFIADIKNRSELLQKWEEGWKCLFHALESIREDEMELIVYIRNQGHTVFEALIRQLAHYAYHVGQIVYIGRMLKGGDWQSLTIPKGQSEIYNREKFRKEKTVQHFTDEFLKKEKDDQMNTP